MKLFLMMVAIVVSAVSMQAATSVEDRSGGLNYKYTIVDDNGTAFQFAFQPVTGFTLANDSDGPYVTVVVRSKKQVSATPMSVTANFDPSTNPSVSAHKGNKIEVYNGTYLPGRVPMLSFVVEKHGLRLYQGLGPVKKQGLDSEDYGRPVSTRYLELEQRFRPAL